MVEKFEIDGPEVVHVCIYYIQLESRMLSPIQLERFWSSSYGFDRKLHRGFIANLKSICRVSFARQASD